MYQHSAATLCQGICAAIRALCCYQSCASLKHETSLLPQKWLSAKSEKDKQEQQVRRCTTFTHNLSFTQPPLWKFWRPSGSFKRIRYCPGGVRCCIMIPVLTMMRRRVTEGQSRMYRMLERRCSRTDGQRLGFFFSLNLKRWHRHAVDLLSWPAQGTLQRPPFT